MFMPDILKYKPFRFFESHTNHGRKKGAAPIGAAPFLRPWFVWDSKKRNGLYFRISGMNMKTIFKCVNRTEKN